MVLRAAILALFVVGCGGNDSSATSDAGDEGQVADATTPDGGGSDGQPGGDAQPGNDGGGAITCGTPSTSYAKNGSTCGSFRWAVKTGTDSDVAKVDMTPQVTTIPTLIALATPSNPPSCGRVPAELQTYELVDVNLKFEALEADSDYHLVASDPNTGKTMVIEVPYPGCVGHYSCQSSNPWYCEITRARAAVDAKGANYGSLGVGTVVGAGFFDTYELASKTPPAGMAPNGIELHPILGICFGKGCNPLQGY